MENGVIQHRRIPAKLVLIVRPKASVLTTVQPDGDNDNDDVWIKFYNSNFLI